MASAGVDRDRHRPVPGNLVARPLALAAAGRPRHRPRRVFFLLTAAAFAPLLMLRVPSRIEGLRRLDRNSGLPHRPATAIADEIAVPTEDSYSVALWCARKQYLIVDDAELDAIEIESTHTIDDVSRHTVLRRQASYFGR